MVPSLDENCDIDAGLTFSVGDMGMFIRIERKRSAATRLHITRAVMMAGGLDRHVPVIADA